MILKAGSVPTGEWPSAYPLPWRLPRDRMATANLGDAGGLAQFGVYLQTLRPGGQSSQRHWHETEDEFVLVLSGRLVVIENDGAHDLGPGDAVAWPAGVANGHCLVNRSGADATYLIVGTRADRDRCHYPDIDLVCDYRNDGEPARYGRRDGTEYPR